MIVFENKGFQTNSLYPDKDWTEKANYLLEDGSELANKIQELYPYYDFVLDGEGNLIDVTAIERPPEPKPTQQQQREVAYETMLYKEDGTPLILWEGEAITVDTANKKWLDYSAEGSTIANELSALIVEAKAYIRELYPDRYII